MRAERETSGWSLVGAGRGRPLFYLLVPVALLAATACPPPLRHAGSTAEGEEPRRPGEKPDPDRAKVLARVGSGAITVGMLEDELSAQNHYARMRYSSPERKKDFLQSMIRFEVLVAEARRRKLDREPEVVKRMKRAMVDRMMEKMHTSLVSINDVTDEEVRTFYEKNTSFYKQAPTVRVSQIVTRTRAEAEKVLAHARQKPADVEHFNALVRAHSIDEASKARHGDLDFFAADTDKVPAEVVQAAFGIRAMWQLAGPVKTEQGYVVLMKTGERDEVNRPIELERERIRNQLYNEKRRVALERFVAELEAQAKIEIFEESLAKVKVDLSAKPGSGPRSGAAAVPGMMPLLPQGHPH